MIIESIGAGYYAGVMRGLDLIVVKQKKEPYWTSFENKEGVFFVESNQRLEIIKRLSEIAFF